jgi:hypothetical protein
VPLPWLINDLKYDLEFSKNWTNSVSLVYNVYGKRIFSCRNKWFRPLLRAQPFSKLDLVCNKIGKNWDAKFSIDNILNPKYSIKVGDEIQFKLMKKTLTVKDFKKRNRLFNECVLHL